MKVKYKNRTYTVTFEPFHRGSSHGTWTAKWANCEAESLVSMQKALEYCHEMIEEREE